MLVTVFYLFAFLIASNDGYATPWHFQQLFTQACGGIAGMNEIGCVQRWNSFAAAFRRINPANVQAVYVCMKIEKDIYTIRYYKNR